MAGYFWTVLQSVQLKLSVLSSDLSGLFYACVGNIIKPWTKNLQMARDNEIIKGGF